MAAAISVPELRALPDWSAVPSNSEDDRVLMNLRLAHFGLVIFALNGAFYLFNLVLGRARGVGVWDQISHPAVLFHAGAIAVSGIEWLLCRRAQRSSTELNLIDVGSVMGIALCCAFMVSVRPHGLDQALVLMLIAMATLFTRAVVVPGTARRTLWITTAAHAPLLVASYYVLSHGEITSPFLRLNWNALSMTFYVGMWSFLTITLSTFASRLIYGLSQRVREATQLGQYTLEEKIGEGGMGIVFRARHALLCRPTAVKLLPLERAGARNVQRFEREVQLTSALTHPNTIAIYDYGHTPDGIFYYAMEYLDGISLEELVTHDGPQPAARVKHLLKQVAGALAEAHGVGLIHRDVKPANLVLCIRGGVPDQLKVLDFGLVMEVSDDASASPTLSSERHVVGTPLYMAPEAIQHPSSVDARADLYALGAVAYHLLTGSTVFSGATAFEVCAKHLYETPEPPSKRLGRPVPRALETLVLACLAKDPNARPRSAQAIIEQLDADTEIPPWTQTDAARWWEERSRAVIERARTARASAPSSPGIKTIAVDLARRENTSAHA